MLIKAANRNLFEPKGLVKRKTQYKKSDLNYPLTPLKMGVVTVLLMVIVCVSTLLILGSPTYSYKNHPISSTPTLLSSDLVEAQEAELRIVIWFDKGKPPRNFWGKLPEVGWVWQEGFSGSMGTGYSLTGYTVIDRESEKKVFSWYQNLAKDVAEAGGIAYLDERIPEGIDIAHYAISQNISPQQFSLSEGTASVVGRQDSFLPLVMAGGDQVNIQVISRGYGEGKTALAIPVLLEEF